MPHLACQDSPPILSLIHTSHYWDPSLTPRSYRLFISDLVSFVLPQADTAAPSQALSGLTHPPQSLLTLSRGSPS